MTTPRVVRLVGNDDSRPVRVWVEDLHPNSRLRRVLESIPPRRSGRFMHRMNASRDVIRSLVSSQRHNRLLAKGDATEDELRSELARDCVSVSAWEYDDAAFRPVQVTAQALARALAQWPLLKRSARLSARTEWACAPSFCYLRFAKRGSWDARIARRFLSCAVRMLIRTSREPPIVGSSTELMGTHLLDDGGLIDRFEKEVSNDACGPFWFAKYDFGTAKHDPVVDAVVDELIDTNEFERVENRDANRLERSEKFYSMSKQFHEAVPDIHAMFSKLPGDDARERSALQVALLDHGMHVRAWDVAPEFRGRPLVFPTMWTGENRETFDDRFLVGFGTPPSP